MYVVLLLPTSTTTTTTGTVRSETTSKKGPHDIRTSGRSDIFTFDPTRNKDTVGIKTKQKKNGGPLEAKPKPRRTALKSANRTTGEPLLTMPFRHNYWKVKKELLA
jgi:hypothetical protein